MQNNLSHLKVGDKIAIRDAGRISSDAPRIDHIILTVKKKTATQLVAVFNNCSARELRVRIEGGRIVGNGYNHAIEATPEILTKHDAQTSDLKRYMEASKALNSLIGFPLHQLKLSTTQLEHLAKAWSEIKTMGN